MNTLWNNIRENLIDYITGKIPLSNFEDWLVPASWNVHQNEDRSTTNLVFAIELKLAEYSNGLWTEDELKEHFHFLHNITCKTYVYPENLEGEINGSS